ncbi:hypothetical protein CY34DRAFT_13828 [Suillus luteus UH-Slu-Lm8-n1]|uniref:Uncharacterized protein n=1 Tax=Suillus luteus UH-Slu-Lm8-n1 TaxID=930992 RepID=A0A0D0B166_9AGAM|nr:hypothetical protein CY34DRAFT_13828 [Suillus luteus UH-Slu-Lm8-n1]
MSTHPSRILIVDSTASKVFRLKTNCSIVPPFPSFSFPIMFLSPSPYLVCLERFWEDFESLRHGAGGINTLGGGLAFIFECLNIIWEALRQRIVTLPSTYGTRNAAYTADRLVGLFVTSNISPCPGQFSFRTIELYLTVNPP